MKLEKKDNLRILHPAKNMILANKDKTEFAEGDIYLGKFDSEKNYTEITPQERDEILAKLDSQLANEETEC